MNYCIPVLNLMFACSGAWVVSIILALCFWKRHCRFRGKSFTSTTVIIIIAGGLISLFLIACYIYDDLNKAVDDLKDVAIKLNEAEVKRIETVVDLQKKDQSLRDAMGFLEPGQLKQLIGMWVKQSKGAGQG